MEVTNFILLGQLCFVRANVKLVWNDDDDDETQNPGQIRLENGCDKNNIVGQTVFFLVHQAKRPRVQALYSIPPPPLPFVKIES